MRFTNFENKTSSDDCAQMTREHQNKSMNHFFLDNVRGCECTEALGNSPLYLENNMIIKDGYGYTGVCGVDNDSDLRLKSMNTNPRSRTNSCIRWDQGLPNLNKGGLIPNIDTNMKNGRDTSYIRSCDRLAEKDFERFVPLTGCLASTIQNPDYIVEPWIRGGSETRNDVRSSEYLERCGWQNNGNTWVRKN
jgi:hypothetical protein